VIKPNSDYKQQWDESYLNGDNNILYPQAEVIRFLNRYITKRNNDGTITRIIQDSSGNMLKGLDFACGVGTHCTTFADFEIDGYGVDISQVAIAIAVRNARLKAIAADRFNVLDGQDQTLPFDDNFFHFSVAESCLDSMPFEVARKYVTELKRVSQQYIYASFIGRDDAIASDEFIVTTEHENGTVQSVFDPGKIADLFSVEAGSFDHFACIEQHDCKTGKLTGRRYYCVLSVA